MKLFSKKKKLVLAIVLLVITLAELFINFYMPLLSEIRQNLQATEQHMQLSVALYLLSLGMSSALSGGISDIIGRRFTIIGSLIILTLSSAAAAMAESIEMFLLFRFIQGIGGGGGWPVGNAIMYDVFNDREFTSANILVHIIVGATPILSLMTGGIIGEIFGWRLIFIALSTLSCVVTIIVICFFTETISFNHRKKISTLIGNYITVITARQYWYLLITKVLIVAIIFVLLSSLPLLFLEYYQLDASHSAFLLSFGFAFYTISGIIDHALANKYDLVKLIYIGIGLILFSAIIQFITFALNIELNSLAIQLSFAPAFAGFGFIFGNATSIIVSSVPRLAGSCSAIMIAIEMLFSAISIALISFYNNGTTLPIAIMITTYCIISFISIKILAPKSFN